MANTKIFIFDEDRKRLQRTKYHKDRKIVQEDTDSLDKWSRA